MEEELKKARGRPRKYPVDTEPKEKRPRGRPKKAIDEAELNKGKRPRGRPKKAVDESLELREKRPRGRPKKDDLGANDAYKYEDREVSPETAGAPIVADEPMYSGTNETVEANEQGAEALYDDFEGNEANIAEPVTFAPEELASDDEGYEEPIEKQSGEDEAEVYTLPDADFDEAMELFDDEPTPLDETESVAYDDEDFDSDIVDNIDAIMPAQKRSIKDATQPKIVQKTNAIPAKHLKSEPIVTYEEKSQKLNEVFTPQEQKINMSRPHAPTTEVDHTQKTIIKTKNTNKTKVVVITGATSGLGLAMAKNLAGLGQVVLAIGRRPSACRDALTEIKAEYPDANVHFLVADLSLMGQVRILVDEIKQKIFELGYDAIDVLIHNAGIQTNMHKVTYENHEIMWATNYLSAFLLTKELQPLLDASRNARVILTTNDRANKTKIDWRNVRAVTPKSNDEVYNQTKLADLMFALEYDHKYADRDDLHAYCVNPGRVDTDLRTKNTSGIKRFFAKFGKKKSKTIAQGIETTMYLCLAERLPKNVVYYENKKPTEPSRFALDPRNRSALWRYTELELQQ